jgi:hypothetical protein
MEEVVGSVFDLMGKTADPLLEEELIHQRVDCMFEVITKKHFLYLKKVNILTIITLICSREWTLMEMDLFHWMNS